jgi:glycosyltransferase involved in cell wall biosynthesis
VGQTDRVFQPDDNRIAVGSSDVLDALAVLDSFGLLAVLYAHETGPARILLAAVFLFYVPGRAIVDNWPTLARWSQVAMPLVLSLVATGLLATVILWAHAWDPLLLFQIEAWVSVVGVGVGAARRHTSVLQLARVPAFDRARRSTAETGLPIWVGLVDLDSADTIASPNGQLRVDHQRARMLVRMHHAPLGYIDVAAQPQGTLDIRSLSEAHVALDKAVQGHMACDALADNPQTSKLWFARAGCPLRFPKTGVEGLTIAVCTRDRVELLRQCLQSLQKVDADQIEILVIDNAPSDDSTRELVMSLATGDRRIRYSCEPTPGLSHARNHALALARFAHVAFTDDDVTVDPGWPRALAAGFVMDPEIVCVTGLVASSKLETFSQRYFDSRIPWGQNFVPRRFDLRDHRDPQPLYPFNAGLFGAGANFAVRVSAVAEIGGFDARLGVGSAGRGGEDLDIFVRLILAGGRICNLPSALVWHTERSERDSLRKQMYDYGHGLGAYLAKHVGERELRVGLLKHGVSHARSIRRRQQDASRKAKSVRVGLWMASAEGAGVLAGAIRYWVGSRRIRGNVPEEQ